MIEMFSGWKKPETTAEHSALAVLTTIVEKIGIDKLAHTKDAFRQQTILDEIAETINDIYQTLEPTRDPVLSRLKLNLERKNITPSNITNEQLIISRVRYGIELLNTVASESVLVHYNLDPNMVYRQVFVKEGATYIVESEPIYSDEEVKTWLSKRIRERKGLNASKYGSVLRLNRYPQTVHEKAFYHDTPKIWISRSKHRYYTIPYLIDNLNGESLNEYSFSS